jgi:hypothetical protein
MITMTDAFLLDALNNLLLLGPAPNNGILNGSLVGLYTNTPFIWTPRAKLADLTEASYTGYARQPAAFLTPWVNPVNQAEVAGDTLLFQPTPALVVPVTIIGYFLVDSTGLILLGGDNLPTPVVLQLVTDAVVIVPDFTLGDQT